MAETQQAQVHLKRAYDLISGVDNATKELEQRAMQHNALADQAVNAEGVGGWLTGMAATWRSQGQLGRDKTALLDDLQLASQELDRAEAVDRGVVLESGNVSVNIPKLRALIAYCHGVIEIIWGTVEKAKELLQQSLQTLEFAQTHYMLGLLCESDYRPQDALKHFEKCLQLEPNGEFSISALREANAMRNYKKRFRGNWLLLVILVAFYIIPGVLYWRAKYK